MKTLTIDQLNKISFAAKVTSATIDTDTDAYETGGLIREVCCHVAQGRVELTAIHKGSTISLSFNFLADFDEDSEIKFDHLNDIKAKFEGFSLVEDDEVTSYDEQHTTYIINEYFSKAKWKECVVDYLLSSV